MGLESPISGPQEDGIIARIVMRGGQSEDSIPIQIGRNQRKGKIPYFEARGASKGAFAIPQKHGIRAGRCVRRGKVESTILIQVRSKDGKRLSPYREGEAYRKVQRGCLFALVGNPVPVAIFAPAAC